MEYTIYDTSNLSSLNLRSGRTGLGWYSNFIILKRETQSEHILLSQPTGDQEFHTRERGE